MMKLEDGENIKREALIRTWTSLIEHTVQTRFDSKATNGYGLAFSEYGSDSWSVLYDFITRYLDAGMVLDWCYEVDI